MSTAVAEQATLNQWGQAPFALAPAALRAVAGDRPAPDFLVEKIGEPVKLRSLDARFWDRGIELDKDDISRLVRWFGGLLGDFREAAIAEVGFPPVPLIALCLQQPSHRAFEKALGKELIRAEELTIGTLLDLPNVGAKRTLEFLSALDRVIDDAYRKPPPSISGGDIRDRRRRQRTPREIKAFFRVLAAWTIGERNEKNFRNALPEPNPSWPPELLQLWKRVRYCSTEQLAGSLAQRYGVPRLIEHAFRAADSRHRMILQARVFSSDSPTSLESLGRVLDCSVDQIKLLQREALAMLGKLQRQPYKPVILRARSLRQRLGSAIPLEDDLIRESLDWAVADFGDAELRDFARMLMFWLAGPYRQQNGWYVASADLAIRSIRALLKLRNDDGIIGHDGVQQALSRLGVIVQFRSAWVQRLGEFADVPNGVIWSDAAATELLPQLPQ